MRQVAGAVGGPPVRRGKPMPVDAAASQRPDAADEHRHHAGHSDGGWDSPVHACDQQAGASEDRQRGEDLMGAAHRRRYTVPENGLPR